MCRQDQRSISVVGSPFQSVMLLVAVTLLAATFLGCAAQGPPRAVFPPRGDSRPLKIAVLPFQRVLPDQSMRTVVCPVSGLLYRACPSPDKSEQLLQDRFLEALPPAYSRNLIPVERSEAVYKRISSSSFTLSPLEVVKRVGEELEADAVLAGNLFCFRERVGYNYAAEKPASVVFGIYLYRVSDGALVWKGIFDKTQQSLFENVLDISTFVKGRGKWVEAGALLQEGVEEVLKSFPELH